MTVEPENGEGRRLSISERAVRDIVENVVLKLQITLAQTYASLDAVKRLEDSHKEAMRVSDERFKSLTDTIDGLEKDKAGRDAVTSFKKWLTGGALFATVFMGIQVAISIWLVTRGSHTP